MSQPTLPGLQPQIGLTRRQRFALELVQRAGRPVPSVELGAALHEYRLIEGGRGHQADLRCVFCQSEGSSMARSLERKGLLRLRRGEGWTTPEWARVKEPSLQLGRDEPWPEGFF